MIKHVPNILTLLRFILIVPIVISIAHEGFIVALILLVISGLTDVLDGAIARKFNFITDFGKILLYLILVSLVLNGNFEINTLILLITYFENIMKNTKSLMGYSRQIREWSISITRINNILNYSSKEQLVFGTNENYYINGMFEFENVNFSYKTKNKGNIENISFQAEPNKITALVGHSGSGKTTITNLILRKYKIDSGKILIDNEDIYKYSKNIFSTNVVGVNQLPFLFNMSIR